MPATQEPDREGRVEPPPGMYPRGTRVGVPAIDSILDAVEGLDQEALESRVRLQTFECQSGADPGVAPACPDGAEDGADVEAIPFGCDDFRVGEAELREGLRRWLLADRYLYAVRRDEKAPLEDGDDPEYGIILAKDLDTAPTWVVRVAKDGAITSMTGCGLPEQEITATDAHLVPPLPAPAVGEPGDLIASEARGTAAYWFQQLYYVTGEGPYCEECNETLTAEQIIRSVVSYCTTDDKHNPTDLPNWEGYDASRHGDAVEALIGVCGAAGETAQSLGDSGTDSEWLAAAENLKERLRPHVSGDGESE